MASVVIKVTEDSVIVENMHFAHGTPDIDTGGRHLIFRNNLVESDGPFPPTVNGIKNHLNGGNATIINNIFRVKSRPKKPWWKFG